MLVEIAFGTLGGGREHIKSNLLSSVIMANSIQTFEGKTTAFDDLDLMVVILLVLKLLSTLPNTGLASKLTERWKGMLSSYGPGIIDLELASWIRSTDEKSWFLNIIHQIEQGLSEYGEIIPGSVLNGLGDIPGVVFSSYRSNLIVATFKLIERLADKITPQRV